MAMRYLVVDRSTARASASVLEAGAPIFEQIWDDGGPGRAPAWLADLTGKLDEAGIAASSLDGFICGLGPGSFSGIRSALAALNGMALPAGKPVYGLASAAAAAFGGPDTSDIVAVVGDARRDRLWVTTYQLDRKLRRARLMDGRIPTHTDEDFRLVSTGELAAATPNDAMIVSPDWDRIGTRLRDLFPDARLTLRAVFPGATDAGRLVVGDFQAARLEPLPIYLHPAVAERLPT